MILFRYKHQLTAMLEDTGVEVYQCLISVALPFNVITLLLLFKMEKKSFSAFTLFLKKKILILLGLVRYFSLGLSPIVPALFVLLWISFSATLHQASQHRAFCLFRHVQTGNKIDNTKLWFLCVLVQTIDNYKAQK